LFVAKLNLGIDDPDVDRSAIAIFCGVEHAREDSAEVAEQELGQRASLAARRSASLVFYVYMERALGIRHVGGRVLTAKVAVAGSRLVAVRRAHKFQFQFNVAARARAGRSVHGLTIARLRVRDTGVGIKREDLGKLFIEFNRIDSPMTRRQEGTGLGLSLTKKLVELQRGSIAVASDWGKGSVFTVLLPFARGTAHDAPMSA
jgi:hypothetical protein